MVFKFMFIICLCQGEYKCHDNRAILSSAFSTTLRIVPGRGEAVIKYLLTPLINDIKMFQRVFLEET